MEALAKHRYARTSAQKARLVADQIRGLHVEKALEFLLTALKKLLISQESTRVSDCERRA